ncbi:MAG: hypothetical protein H0W74_04580 [Sphingosinicella sp.]|nr:hypothetical protein [Sphingosinicella sp.]
MSAIAKKIACGTAAAFLLLSTTVPAEARHRRHYDRDDVDAGDVIGAAIVLGGIAAILSASKGRDYGGTYGAERKAVKACVREAESGGSRYETARVDDVTNVDRRDGYYFVRGMLETRSGSHYPGGPARGRDGWQEGEREGFTCTARGKKVYDFQRSGGYHW